MSRARATALALVNWKGVFYERYLLDRHVTVLEGANGAGKTTVMIAAYVVLLPDMSRLRFTNLGESGATGGDRGIWGRLGEPGRPSYAALEVESRGERVIIGVRLERKAEPTIELSPFLITGLDLGGRLKEVLLATHGDHDEVPDLGDLRDAVVQRGGALTVFASAKEYFSTLFDRGITPLRLATEEDRQKTNEMLRTSMTGGISRALTSELRSFLLKEETGLADTLARMRQNLTTCHRTRTEVGESRELEQEIAGVHEAGRRMFATAMLAAKGKARELDARADEAREGRDTRARESREIERRIADTRTEKQGASTRAAAARTAVGEALARGANVARAEELQRRREALTPAQDRTQLELREASAARDATATERQARKLARDRAREAHDRASYGVGDLQAGLDELHKTVHARKLAARRLSEVREALARPTFDEPDIDAALATARVRTDEIAALRAKVDRMARSSVEQRDRHEVALAALARIEGVDSPGEGAPLERARNIDSRYADLEALAKRVPELSTAHARSIELRDRQALAAERARGLGLDLSVEGREEPAASAATLIGGAIDRSENDARRAELESREHERVAVEAKRRVADARTGLDKLDAITPRWLACRKAALELEAVSKTSIRSREDALAARLRLAGQVERQRATVEELRARQEELGRRASELDAAGGAFHPDLLRIRDELDAELVAGRFEELDPTRAAELEAELGPLANALIVDDPIAAARSLAGAPRELREILLVRPDATLFTREARSERPGTDLMIEEAYGVRLTRMPDNPSIGRLARERRATELRAEAESVGASLEEALATEKRLDVDAERAGSLVAEADLLEHEDPVTVATRIRAELDALEEAQARSADQVEEAEARATVARRRSAALRSLLTEAFLLDPPDQNELALRMGAELTAAREARDEVRRTEKDRRVLAELREALHDPPVSAEEVRRLQTQRVDLDAEQDRVFALIEALEDLQTNRAVLALPDIAAALEEKTAVAPVLQAQLDAARQALVTAEDAVATVEAAWERASAAWQSASVAADTVREQTLALDNALHDDLARLGLGELTPDLARLAERAVTAAETERAAVEREEQRLTTELALLEERLVHAARARTEAEGRLADAEQRARPARAAWNELERTTSPRSAKALESPLAGGDLTSDKLSAEARSQAQVLVERARHARGGADCALEVERVLASKPSGIEADSADYLAAWRATEAWIKNRLPAQISTADDPLEALVRLRDHLSLLEGRLERQETDLRGTSEDVARGIEVRLARAKAQVRRLNQTLTGVRFGNIVGIRVEMKRIERMDAVLRALREGTAQELLFQSNLPIEEALDEIFRRYGGGRTGGQRILDYREYAELAVEVQRNGETDWEPASPTRLSTGEAIGVGAALMMVVLTEWERDGNLLRPRADTGGSLRFLFLDEANRLSQDNLGVLFSLCENLDLQLLIAAPEVARAEGNTTYRLVRRVAPDGTEEVIVSGRRVAPSLAG